jgi:hypothetical protein
VDNRDARQRARVRSKELRREIVAALQDDIVLANEGKGIVRQQARRMDEDGQIDPNLAKRSRRGLDFGNPDIHSPKQDLSVKIRPLDGVVVAQSHAPDS